ncbi:MAG: flagellar basal-body rod protein FlgG [Fibrobacterota bacterium]
MIRSIYTGASGMNAMQMHVDNISNNLSNVNTTGYKKTKLEFQDLLYQNIEEPGERVADQAKAPVGLQVGLGVKASANHRIFSQGSMTQTENPLDIGISGSGFFQIAMPDGTIAYTRDGAFKVDPDGMIVNSDGFPLASEIIIPEDTTEINIDKFGQVSALLPGDSTAEVVGQIELATFINPAGLKASGGNLLRETSASGEPVVSIPGMDGLGMTDQGFLELSNVEMIDEMVNLISAQRAYEISSKSVTVSDEMLQVANQLKR